MTTPIHILLVDDETDFLENTAKRLTRRGYDVQSATNCAAALAIVASNWPQVIVLDVMLPDRDGIECLQAIKQNWPTMAVILLTGHASIQTGLRSLEYGANDYCLKPIEFDVLVEKIKIVFREAYGAEVAAN